MSDFSFELLTLDKIKLYGENIINYNFIESPCGESRIYYTTDETKHSFVCLSLDSFASENQWDSCQMISTFYGTVNREGLRTLNLSEGDIENIGVDEDDGQLEIGSTKDLILHLNLIKKLESLFD
jgi:hypothetical protein